MKGVVVSDMAATGEKRTAAKVVVVVVKGEKTLGGHAKWPHLISNVHRPNLLFSRFGHSFDHFLIWVDLGCGHAPIVEPGLEDESHTFQKPHSVDGK